MGKRTSHTTTGWLRPGLMCAGSLLLAVLTTVGCSRREASESPSDDATAPLSLDVTADPALAMTLQAEVAATAAWVAQLTPSPPQTVRPAATLSREGVTGDPPAARTGRCPVGEGDVLHVRLGFCLTAPESWMPFNVDGGPAAVLGTTPGQAISIRPDWAASAAVCDLLIYIANGESPYEVLEMRHAEFEARDDLTALSPVTVYTLGEMALPGFTWETVDGQTGASYVDVIATNRLVYISFGGTQCPAEDLLPVLNTLRFNIEQ